MATEQVADGSSLADITGTPNKKRKFMSQSPNSLAKEMGIPDDINENEIMQTSEFENDLHVSSDSESGSNSDSDSDDNMPSLEDGVTKQSKRKKRTSKFVPRNIIHNFKFPLILEDTGRPGSAEQLANYDFDLNRLMALAQVGRIKTSKKISGNKYIIDCFSNKQRENILKLVQLRTPGGGYIPIKPRVPEPTTEGVIGPIGKNVTMEDLKEKITEYNQCNPTKTISNSDRLRKFQDGVLKETAFIKLTFKCPTLPEAVKLGCNFYPVEANRRDPMLCSKCFRLGHTRNKCFKKHPVCGKCLGPKHEFGEQECPLDKSQWKCPNCNTKGHSASWPRCPQKLKLKNALLIQSKHYMPLAAALELVTGEESKKKNKQNSKPQSRSHSSSYNEQAYPSLRPEHSKTKMWRTYAQTPSHWVDSYPIENGNTGADGESSQIAKSVVKSQTEKSQPISNTLGCNETSSSMSFENIIEAINKNSESMQQKFDKTIKSLQNDTEKKLKSITDSINEIKTQNQEKMTMISEFVKRRKQTANQSEKIALDIVDTIRQAAEGNPEAIFEMAKKLSKSGQDIGNDLKAEISKLTQSISF